MFLQALIGALFGIGLFYIFSDIFKIPYIKSSKAVKNLSQKQSEKVSAIDVWLDGIATWLSKHLKLNEYKRAELARDLKSAQIEQEPEEYKAHAIVKAGIVGILSIPMLFVLPLFSPILLFLAVFIYNRESKRVSRSLKIKRRKIEYELPGLVYTIEKTLKHSRDVLFMLESHAEICGPELKHELNITTADMRSGNYESAITRLEDRIGSSMLSDICRGLIGILRGDDTRIYFSTLSVKFADIQRQQLRAEAQKVPKKVKRLSMCLLFCFMLIYVVVILSEIMSSLDILFT